MGNRSDTEIGGFQGRFSPTQWTVIVHSQASDEDTKRLILNELFQKYWKPVYWYLRNKGYGNEKSKDLTQGFFAEIVWGKDLIRSADPQKGRFRDFLIGALKHYLSDVWRYEHAQVRMPSKEIFSMDAGKGFEMSDMHLQTNAEEAFNSIWLMEILQQSLAEVQRDMQEDGKGSYWTLFERCCMNPILKASKPPALKDICETLDIQDLTKASNMIVTVKRRVKKAMIRNLQKIAASRSDLEEEITLLIGKIKI